jgi:integrase
MKKKHLTPTTVKHLIKRAKPGSYADGESNLYLQIKKVGEYTGASWIMRYTSPDGRSRSMGLGSVKRVPLKKARELAADEYAKLKSSNPVDPIAARQHARDKARAESAKRMTFKEAAEKYIAHHGAKWSNDQHRKQWQATLAAHAYPIIGDMQIEMIERSDIMRVLLPIWTTTHTTAERLRGRIERILEWAAAVQHKDDRDYHYLNPAESGRLVALLPAPEAKTEEKHLAALPYNKMQKFMTALRSREGIAPRLLEFIILTGVRTKQATRAVWGEIDLDSRVWTIPVSRNMKTRETLVVPLSGRAVELLQSLPRESGSPYVFIGTKAGHPVGANAARDLAQAINPDITVHGFRSTHRDWGGDETNHPREVIEHALGHKVGNDVENAYRRGRALLKRRRLMEDWARYLDGKSALTNEEWKRLSGISDLDDERELRHAADA